MQFECPLPQADHDRVQIAHGAGGRLSRDLMATLFMPALNNPVLAELDDQARLILPPGRVAFTTDTYVITPLFFPGGNIGELAVHGTVNDLAVGGAVPRFLSAGFVLEEGFPLADLQLIVSSLGQAAAKAGVSVVTGDTKVVQKGQCDGVFINTSGIGEIREGIDVSCGNLQPGDRLILSGTLADHGIAVLCAREGLSMQMSVESDSASLNAMISAVLDVFPGIHAMRDPTRGGAAATLNELASASGVGIVLEEEAIPLHPEVRGACELLGIDPLTVANEGKVIIAVPSKGADAVLDALRRDAHGKNAVVIGEAVGDHPGVVVMRTAYGSRRVVEMPLGEQLPRIC